LTVAGNSAWAACNRFVELTDKVTVSIAFWTHDPKAARNTANNPRINAIETA
jgi:hypothetical protein